MMSTEAELFLKSVLAEPRESLRRLVFADWLEDTSLRSNVTWAKYLRLSDEIEQLPINDPARAKQLVVRERLSGLITAKLRIKAEAYFADPEAYRLILPLRCLILDIETFRPCRATIEAVPEHICREMQILPLKLINERTLFVGAAEPLDAETKQALRYILDRDVESVLVQQDQVNVYQSRIFSDRTEACNEQQILEFVAPRHYLDQSPVARIVEMIFSDAEEQGVRDIRIQRAGPRIDIRFLRDNDDPLWGGFPSRVHRNLVRYLAELAQVDPEVWNEEQSGMFRYPLPHRVLDIAARFHPTRSGPVIHLTILPNLNSCMVKIHQVA